MRAWRLIGGALAAVLLASAPALANPRNALDAYVAKPDPAFGWKVVKQLSGPGYHAAVLDLASQSWLTPKQVDHTVWHHWLTVIVPDKVAHRTGFMFITGGKIGDPAPDKATERFAKMALETNSVVSELDDVPNQPLRFTEDPKPRVEDEIIAYQQAKFARDRNPLDLVRLPMVKSGTAAMTAIQQYLATPEGGKLPLDHFVVSGGSKRAWTTWLVGALDPRVVAIIPIVINVLDVDATTRHHWEAMGYFSPALKDYVDNGLIPNMIGKPGIEAVNKIEDPLNYRDRPSMKMPKYIINAVGDEYFPPDNTRFSYHLLPQVKRLRMIPNSKHSTAGTDISDSMTAFYAAILDHRPIPNYAWSVGKDGAIVLHSDVKPMEVYLWQGTNPNARDFRVDTIGKVFTSTRLSPRPDGTYRGDVPKPKTGFTAYFLEVLYPSGTKYPFKFTTEVYVKPDVYPYRWKDARPIIAPDAKWKPAAEALKSKD
ncbi:PhoPQ-activated protein PqaA family protein [Phenylobacterium sp.]|uniref:PhoPQ-activated protein PqaA family protein n=1 Tax=Phenylobacterium sp. TaxID=1871053 RepID=UPI002607097C|nr:PhoPQ-activated protein PqaA family protein [Phenylobacterium sp.]